MKLNLLLATLAFAVLVLAFSGWLVHGVRSRPRFA
jgi:hypothetical protein